MPCPTPPPTAPQRDIAEGQRTARQYTATIQPLTHGNFTLRNVARDNDDEEQDSVQVLVPCSRRLVP